MSIYIENDQEMREICRGNCPAGDWQYDVSVGFEIFDQRHGLKYDMRARAEYKEFCKLPLSFDEDRLLHPEKYEG